jgi:hypothetical protein
MVVLNSINSSSVGNFTLYICLMAFSNTLRCSTVFICWTSQYLCTSCNTAGFMCCDSYSGVVEYSGLLGVWHRVVGSVIPDTSGTTDPTTHHHLPEDLNLLIRMSILLAVFRGSQRRGLWCQVYKYSDTTECSGTATRLTYNVELQYYCWI